VIERMEAGPRGGAAGHTGRSRLRGYACVVSKRYSLANDYRPSISPNVYKGSMRLTAIWGSEQNGP
jgi:hypothetical protein